MLSGKEKRYLRGIASKKRAILQVGKDGVKDNMIKTLHDALEAHELVKVSVLQNCDYPIKEVAFDLASSTNSDIIQIIGKTIVFYRRSKNNLMEL